MASTIERVEDDTTHMRFGAVPPPVVFNKPSGGGSFLFEVVVGAYADRDALLTELGFRDYEAYLRSLKWRTIRERALRRDNHQCRVCSVLTKVVHHDSYDRATLLGESLDSLYSLCETHHDAVEFDYTNGTRRKRSFGEVRAWLQRLLAGQNFTPKPKKPKQKKGEKKVWKSREEREYVPRTQIGAAMVAKRLAWIQQHPNKKKIPSQFRWGRIRRVDQRHWKVATGPTAFAGPYVPQDPKPARRLKPELPGSKHASCPFVATTSTRVTEADRNEYAAAKVAFMRSSPFGRMPAELQDIRVWLGAKKRESAPLVL